MTIAAETPSRRSVPSIGMPSRLRLVTTLAARELRSGLSGFRIFIACIALGVAIITAVGALADALLDGFSRQGRTLIGGDVTYTRVHQRATEDERTRMAALGQVSEAAFMRSMARRPETGDQSLVEIKGVDGGYPLVGAVALRSGANVDDVLRTPGAAVVPKALIDRLGLEIGDTFTVGGATVQLADELISEPDTVAARLPFGPRVMVSTDTLMATGLVGPGTLVYWRYAIALSDPALRTGAGAGEARDSISSDFLKAGFIVRDRANPSPEIERVLERLRQFLMLLGLTALLVGGVGVANAVGTFVEKRRKVIATYKSVGGSSGLVFQVLLAQVLVVASVGIAIGVVFGMLIPALVAILYGSLLPVQITLWSGVASGWIGAVYGYLVALLFTVWPLGRTERIRPAGLFRDEVGTPGFWPGRRALVIVAVSGAALVAFAILASGTPAITLGFLGGVSVVLALFWALGTGVTYLARHMRRPRRAELALAITGLGAPGGLTRSVVVSLGAGLSLLVAVALVDRSLVAELSERLPENSPDYFAVDIQRGDLERFQSLVRSASPGASVETAPMLRGRITAVDGVRADEFTPVDPEGAWALRGDRGLSFSATVPQGSKVIAGDWWADDYAGPPLVSFVADLARELGLEVGDTITVSVLGREVTARIANLREIVWEDLTINFIMVFSPNTLAAAPYNILATVRLPNDAAAGEDAAVGRAVSRELPAISMVRVRDAIERFAELFANVMTAIRAAGALTLVAGAIVLAGALATAQHRRVLQAVILKCIGATRRKLLTAHLIEYGLLALIASTLAIGVGMLAAWVVCVFVLDVAFTLSVTALVSALVIATAMILLFGGIGTWRVLSARPVPYLRAL